jgi:hypothetical protein
MKYISMALVGMAAAFMVVTAEAAPKAGKGDAMAQKRTACQAQAARRYSAIRFLARRDYVRRCMGEGRSAKKG